MSWLALLAAVALAAAPKDNDDFDIPEPAADKRAALIWSNGAYLMSFYQAEKALDPAWLLRKARLLPPREAGNVTELDEAPDSTWFTNRHGYERLAPERVAEGPGGPAPRLPFVVLEASPHSENVRFVALDQEGRRWFVKLDPPGRPGLATNGELIASRLLHAAGYNVPFFTRVWLRPGDLRLGPEATMRTRYRNAERKMAASDLSTLFALAGQAADGRFPVSASLALPGKPKGPFSYLGTRGDDPNDTVRHEDRRELRGYQVLSAWLNNTDSRQGNSLDVYVEEGGRRFLRHYLLDFSAAFGSGNNEPKRLEEGTEYYFDAGVVVRSAAALGLWVKPWERARAPDYPELGPFHSDDFHPLKWKPSYANPAFERLTPADGYWGAKLVTAFSDADVEAAAEPGHFPTPGAKGRLLRVLGERRDIIGRYWLGGDRVAPLESFRVEGSTLAFADLGVERGYVEAKTTLYRWKGRVSAEPSFELPAGFDGEAELRVSRDLGRAWGRPVRVRVAGGAVRRVRR